MNSNPSISDIRAVSGISHGYASMLRTGDRTPPRSLAIHLYRKLGWCHESIAALTEEEMAVLEKVEPWIPPAKRDAEEAA